MKWWYLTFNATAIQDFWKQAARAGKSKKPKVSWRMRMRPRRRRKRTLMTVRMRMNHWSRMLMCVMCAISLRFLIDYLVLFFPRYFTFKGWRMLYWETWPAICSLVSFFGIQHFLDQEKLEFERTQPFGAPYELYLWSWILQCIFDIFSWLCFWGKRCWLAKKKGSNSQTNSLLCLWCLKLLVGPAA